MKHKQQFLPFTLSEIEKLCEVRTNYFGTGKIYPIQKNKAGYYELRDEYEEAPFSICYVPDKPYSIVPVKKLTNV